MTAVCYLCQRDGNSNEQYCHKHHVYEGKNRQASERAGFYVYLCPDHHTLVHHDHAANLALKQEIQKFMDVPAFLDRIRVLIVLFRISRIDDIFYCARDIAARTLLFP